MKRKQIESNAQPPRCWLPKLCDLLEQIEPGEILNEEDLLAAVVQDETAGVVLLDLLNLLPRSIREDGAIWKADQHWKDTRGISYRQMNKVRVKLAAVMNIWKENAQGAPTFHYQLNTPGFVSALAGASGHTPVAIRALTYEPSLLTPSITLLPPKEEAEVQNGSVPEPENAKSITDSDSLDSDVDRFSESESKNVVDLLVAAGVNRVTAKEFEALPLEIVRRVIADAKTRPGVKSVGGYVVKTLRNWKTQIDLKSPALEAADDYLVRFHGEMLVRDREVKEVEMDEESEAVWTATLAQLAVQLDGQNFDRWLRGTTVMAVERPEPGLIVLVILTKNSFARDMCASRLYRTIRRLLQDVCSQMDETVEVRFECAVAPEYRGPMLWPGEELPHG